jgi:hypothetical protein
MSHHTHIRFTIGAHLGTAGSGSHINSLMRDDGEEGLRKYVGIADVVFVDTAVNDIADDHAEKLMELLVNVLLTDFTNHPALVYLGTSTKDGDGDAIKDAIKVQSTVAKYYSIPYISFPDAMGPLSDPKKHKFWTGTLTVNHIYLNTLGSKIFAAVIVNFFSTFEHPPINGLEIDNDALSMARNRTTLPLLYTTDEELRMYKSDLLFERLLLIN